MGFLSDYCREGDHEDCGYDDAVYVSYDEYSFSLDCDCDCHD